jgi:hypothetical protein
MEKMKKPVNTEFYGPLICFATLKVGMARFELATSWSQTRRDNRATLHPELLKLILYHLALMQAPCLLGMM